MSKTLRLHKFGDVANLQLDDVQLRPLKPGEARLIVKATGITQDTLTYIKGDLHLGEDVPDMPVTLGYEPAGIVTAVGSDGDKKWINQRVAPIGPFDFTEYGSLGEEIIVPTNRLVSIPENLDFIDAAALWIPYLTAFPVHRAQLSSDDYVLITTATSTVGHAAIQMAKAAGATVIGTTRSRKKAQLLKDTTAIDHIIVTSETDLGTELDGLTHGHGVNFVFDAIGGSGINSIASAMASNGTIIEYGVLAGFDAPLPISQMLSKGLTIRGFAVNEIVMDPKQREEAVTEILAYVKRGLYSPAVATHYPLNEYTEAFNQLKKNNLIGRIILTN